MGVVVVVERRVGLTTVRASRTGTRNGMHVHSDVVQRLAATAGDGALPEGIVQRAPVDVFARYEPVQEAEYQVAQRND